MDLESSGIRTREDRADACMGYLTDKPYNFLKRNIPFVILHPEDYGVDSFLKHAHRQSFESSR